MPALKTYDLFVSHAWTYNQAYYKLIDLLDTAPNLYFRNYSVPSHDPVLDPNSSYGRDKLTRALDAQIRPVNCVVIISGMYATYRYWIDKEIEIAKRYSKPIIGLVPWGQLRTPLNVQRAASEMVRWNASSIVSAIRRHSL